MFRISHQLIMGPPSKKNRIRKSGLRFDTAERDQISDLSDDILLHILSFMDIREALITSVLSRRWQHLWKFCNFTRMSFDEIDLLGYSFGRREPSAPIFAEWVNHVMDRYQGSQVAQLKISCDCEWDPGFGHDQLRRWISFALAKKVTTLDLYLDPRNHSALPSYEDQESSNSSCLEHANLRYCNVTARSLQIFRSLKSLSLSGGILRSSDLESIISTCLSLEKLCLEDVFDLKYVRIVGSSLKLKCLEIDNYYLVKRIVIDAPELRKFTYKGPKTNICLKNTSKLVELKIVLHYLTKNRMKYVLRRFKNVLFQLETMVMEILPHEVKFTHLPTLPNLKTLVLEVPFKDVKLLAFAYLLKASPFLRRFELQLLEPIDQLEAHNKAIKMEDDILEWSHTCLEEVYVGGFCGYEYELELLNYFLKTCTSLKKIALDPYDLELEVLSCPSTAEVLKEVELRRRRARQFGKDKVHSDIKFVVL